MTETEHEDPVTEVLVGLLTLLGVWTVVSPFVISGAENVAVHVVLGVAITALAGWYLVRVHRESAAKLSSLWYVLVLGVLLLSGTLLSSTRGTVFFWSTVLTTVLIVVLVLASIGWGSRFASGEGVETTIFE